MHVKGALYTIYTIYTIYNSASSHLGTVPLEALGNVGLCAGCLKRVGVLRHKEVSDRRRGEDGRWLTLEVFVLEIDFIRRKGDVRQ